ncbi:OPT oligopeptide transporter protein-domain-containing protein [Lobosporangium transversale]|uniref:OPT oligopeptide transporter protein-domain-containing protein n=1 Tax=Lobosporangium transversale TaxID=64571 RepID=A0A1Y2GF47_9FUNG|nr:OPT oligopeptide transporter protein-domain-containing protein [Lobosporangium transversale]ORZ09074.1 OPT oligopeptide transporter protein-domain-containing protein [Lobosporangium transversale]|eukprot:XP_021878701.1 OPT oligopeptide transporter protein-domain-containing protein [Lobosporangium transversale]
MPTVAYSAVPSHENGGDPTNTTPKEELPHFTWRAVGVGITIGALLCFTNMYFGLQTGWISMMSLQSSLLGFAIFKVAKPYLTVPFGPAENIVLQSIAVATGTMPLAAGFVGIIPALQMMNTDDNPPRNGKEGGPIVLSATELILWCLAIAFFGVFIAVPLRKQVIVKEKLPFPSGTATAQMIGVLHNTPLKVHDHHSNEDSTPSTLRQRRRHGVTDDLDDEEQATAILHMTPLGSSANFETSGPGSGSGSTPEPRSDDTLMIEGEGGEFSLDKSFLQEDTWRTNMVALGISFTVSGLYTVLSYFVPVIAAIPVFDWLIPGSVQFGATWQWFFTPSLSYLGQGIIMGFPTTAAMLLGCVIGWGILSPIATLNKWVTGPVSSATSGARGWILWISLGVMIVESVVSLLGVVILSLIAHYRYSLKLKRVEERRKLLESSMRAHPGAQHNNHDRQEDDYDDYDDYDDAPADQLVPLKIWVCGLILSSFLCLFLIWVLFKDQHMPLYATAAALLLGSLLSVLGVRALGSTDLNPVSGIGKVSQFIFGGIVPGGIVANLVAGGIAEAGAQQAGDLMQDLKTGHLMGASPKAQFWGQLIGSLASVFISTGVYKLYSTAYELPGPQFAVPTAKVWLDLARLVNGHSLPEHTGPFILGFSFLFAGLTILTTIYSDAAFLRKLDSGGGGKRPKWLKYIPSGIAFAIGMYNLPNFTLARFLGGLVSIWWDWHCKKYAGQPNTRFANLGRVFLIIIASGFVLGEGTLSIVNLILKTFDVHSWSCAGCVEGICVCN